MKERNAIKLTEDLNVKNPFRETANPKTTVKKSVCKWQLSIDGSQETYQITVYKKGKYHQEVDIEKSNTVTTSSLPFTKESSRLKGFLMYRREKRIRYT